MWELELSMWELRAVSTDMGTVKRCISEGDQMALIQSVQENMKISKDEVTGCTSQESCRQASELLTASLVPPREFVLRNCLPFWGERIFLHVNLILSDQWKCLLAATTISYPISCMKIQMS